ncbi:hypothetical protein [Mycolicibacterium confluentis]|uniref:Uncharacterized protein n=1 Tax=Mycolicibacterium confluentis TaxID=28047 RepID=A0A7I7XT63_9MYCO|nr:hypothetical protein [Mycolicibacterium confluentis]MCV7321117.1 hypothetical protein [Mycolicibacterium confluentis]ORV21285.1 hypothetical protein AWB99_27160 [Mycolicibacterium confluentis]BBZ32407.1 hypothetical protein MCNF_10120 [Mycolicibacterium confluentis]
MQARTRPRAGFVAAGVAVMGIAALTAAPLGPVVSSQPRPIVMQDIRLAAASVPPGGLIVSFLRNQVTYCSIICPLLVQTGVTAGVTTLQAPATFLAALQSNDVLKAIGIAAASVTGPTNAAAAAAILADGTEVAPRALNAFEVGVVGLMNIVPAAVDGLPGVVSAIQTARQDTYTALNLPIVPNPTPTARPEGVVQVAVIGAINVGGAIIFPAFNEVLSAVFEVPDAVAQELAASGNPVRAVAAGVDTAAQALTDAGTIVADAVVKAVDDVRAEAGQAGASRRRLTVPSPSSSVTAESPSNAVTEGAAAAEAVTAADGVAPRQPAVKPTRPPAAKAVGDPQVKTEDAQPVDRHQPRPSPAPLTLTLPRLPAPARHADAQTSRDDRHPSFGTRIADRLKAPRPVDRQD